MSAVGPTSTRIDRLTAAIEATLSPTSLEIIDEGHLHAGHVGAKSGKGHFQVKIVSAHFSGLPLVQRHRLVYAAVGELMESDIHALRIDAIAPSERTDQ